MMHWDIAINVTDGCTFYKRIDVPSKLVARECLENNIEVWMKEGVWDEGFGPIPIYYPSTSIQSIWPYTVDPF